MKKILSAILCTVMLFSLAMCAPGEKTAFNIVTLKGPTGIGMAAMMGDEPAVNVSGDYRFSVVSAPDEIVGKISTGEVDIAAVPTNLAAVLYQKTKGDIQLAALNTLGVLYIVDTTGTVSSVSDLRGKTVYATGQGANPEYVLNYILLAGGLTPGVDVDVEFRSEHAELSAMLASGTAEIGMLPEPHVTSVLLKNNAAAAVIDMTAEWNRVTADGSVLTMGGLIVRREFAEQNKAALNAFLKEYEASVAFAVSNPAEAAKLAEAHDIMNASVAEKAIPRSNLVYIDGEAMQNGITGYYRILFEANPTSIGGVMPDDGFYYKK